MVSYLKIPKERLGVLLAEKKAISELEKATGTKIHIDVETEQIEIFGQKEGDPLGTLKASDVIRAIGRGFDRKTAFRLLEEDAVLSIIDLKEFAGEKKNALARIKSRAIGTEGKAKSRIADMTDTDIAIYGKTISIIGKIENVELACRAISDLCSGSMHNTVYKMLAREVSKIQQKSF